MDHLLANSDNPISAEGEAIDDEDDAEALAAHIKKTGADDQVAKVRSRADSVDR
jgi:hypothetical protein